MIQFFRKIRQALLSEHKFSKYLIYAIGEIALVMIGILLALQVNNWNEERKINDWQERFLVDLKNQLNEDFEQLNKVYNEQMEARNACRNFMELASTAELKNKAEIDSLFHYIAARGNATFFPTTSVYDSGMSTGRIETIKNDSLKYAIMNLYNKFYDRLLYNGEALDEAMNKTAWERMEYYNDRTRKIKSLEALEDFKIARQVNYLRVRKRLYTNMANRALRQMEQIIDLINVELNE